MLEHLPRWLGQALSSVRAGSERLAVALLRPNDCVPIDLGSTAFPNGGAIPARFSADGEGVSPPLHWGPLPSGTIALALLVEDADSPSRNPFVHAVVWDLDPEASGIEEGAIGRDGDGEVGGEQPETGRNSYFQRGWLPLDPPPGHEHHYVFQLFALSSQPEFDGPPGRSALIEALGGCLLGIGVLTGAYSRDEPADVGPIGDAAIA